jgi:hypothetical protein
VARLRLLTWLFLSAVFLLVTSREPPWADAHVTYDTTQNLVDHGSLETSLESGPPWFYARRNGHRYGVFPLGNVVAMVPSYLAYKLLRNLPGVPDKPLFAMICHLSPALMMAAACALFLAMLDDRRVAPRAAVSAALTLGLTTIVLIYARSPYAEALQTVALTWLCERTLAAGRRPTLAGLGWLGVAAGVLLNAKLVYALVLPLPCAYLVYARWRAGDLELLVRRSALGALAFAELLALALWHNHLKTGSILDSGYTIKEGVFSGDAGAALYGFFLSTGKGMFFYSPPLLLGLLGLPTALRRHRAETVFLIAVMAVVVGFNAKFRAWHGDYCWGPRYLTPLAPLLFLCAFPWLPEALARGRAKLRRLSVRALVTAGALVQLLGASLYWDHYIRVLITVKDAGGAPGWFSDALSHGHYIPLFSPISGHWWLLSHLIRRDPDLDADAPWKYLVPQVISYDEAWNRARLDWWPVEWIHDGAPAANAPAGRPAGASPPGGRPGKPVLGTADEPLGPIAPAATALALLAGSAGLAYYGLRRRLAALEPRR